MVHTLSNSNSVLNQFMSEIRDEQVQKDSMRFRRNLERIGEIMAYEISKTFTYKTQSVKTPLGISEIPMFGEQPVVISVLRAGLPLHTGVLNYFDKAENGFISAYRKHNDDDSFDIRIEYLACPDLTNKIVILCDPMLASGSSMVLAYEALLQRGKPAHTHVVSVVASTKGVEYVSKHLPKDTTTVWCAAVDKELNSHAYIVPGLGDAGDLAFGSKI